VHASCAAGSAAIWRMTATLRSRRECGGGPTIGSWTGSQQRIAWRTHGGLAVARAQTLGIGTNLTCYPVKGMSAVESSEADNCRRAARLATKAPNE
jgi:hypothetical protein